MEADDGGGTLLFELGIGEGVLPMLFLKMETILQPIGQEVKMSWN